MVGLPDSTIPDKKIPKFLTWIVTIVLIVHIGLKYIPSYFDHALWPKDSGIDTIGLVLVIIACLPWIAEYLTSAKLPGGIDIAFSKIEQRQNWTDEALKQLKFIVRGFLTDYEYHHLRSIYDKAEYFVKAEHSEPLAFELRRLRAMYLISNKHPDRGVTDFVKHDGKPRTISDWFVLTSRGLEYLSMRSSDVKIEQS